MDIQPVPIVGLDINGTGPATTSAATAPHAPQVFGLLIPGRPVRTDFLPVDTSGTKFALTLDGNDDPRTISDIVFFLLPGINLPQDHGAVLYWNIPNNGFETLGAIGPNRPSGVFRTGWSNNDIILNAATSTTTPMTVTLGVSIEPLGNIVNLEHITTKGVEDRINVAKHIAIDLYNYLQSFDFTNSTMMGMSTPTTPNTITVPSNIFERWMKRFESKSRMDPNFFMKPSE